MKTEPDRMDNLSKTHKNKVFWVPENSGFLSALFKEIYPLIASQIVKRCKINRGIGIDIQYGPGSLAIALAKITALKIYSLDISEQMYLIARQNIEKENLNNRIFPLVADVHQLPFKDNFADLIVSRGSMFFWKDREQSFKDIHRVLKPSGFAYVGGGYGNIELKNKIKKSNKNNKDFDDAKIPKISIEELEKNFYNAGIKNYEIINDDSGLWAVIKN